MVDVVAKYHPHDLRLSAGAVALGAGGANPILVVERAGRDALAEAGAVRRRPRLLRRRRHLGRPLSARTLEGDWRFTTESAVPELDGHTRLRVDLRRCNPNARVHGALRVDPSTRTTSSMRTARGHSCSGTRRTGCGRCAPLPDGGATLRRFCERIARFGFNHVFVNAYAHDTRWRPGRRPRMTTGRRRCTRGRGRTRRPTTCT